MEKSRISEYCSRDTFRRYGSGPWALIFNAIVLYAALRGLSHVSAAAGDRVLVLAIANATLGALLLVKNIRVDSIFPNPLLSSTLCGWSLAYVLIYGIFLCFPAQAPLWAILGAQACAPFLAVFLSGDYLREKAIRNWVLSIVPTPLLFLIVCFMPRTSGLGVTWMVLLLITALYVLSQSCARVVSWRAPSPMWAPPRLALLNAICLFGLWRAVSHADGSVNANLMTLFVVGVLFAVPLLLIQFSYVYGLRNTSPPISALIISVSVPVSLVGDMLIHEKGASGGLPVWLSLAFVVACGVVSRTRLRASSHDTSDTSAPEVALHG
jgi:hypothetical protein